MNKYRMEMAIEEFLDALLEGSGLNPNDANFSGTPQRVAKAMFEICDGLNGMQEKIDNVLKTSFPASEYTGMIFCTGIEVFSMCPHHQIGRAHV